MGYWNYKCESCGHKFEELHSIADQDFPTKEPCPECGEVKVIRIFEAPVINLGFRGSSIQSSPKAPGELKEKLKQIKKVHGADRCKGIEL
jgi:putative FmdB family regulatory protein